jgi:hypothetical protein
MTTHQNKPRNPVRLTWSQPRLTVFGGLSDLTASGTGMMQENVNMAMTACVAASERSPCVIP